VWRINPPPELEQFPSATTTTTTNTRRQNLGGLALEPGLELAKLFGFGFQLQLKLDPLLVPQAQLKVQLVPLA
jgi:hypothetical protein